MQTPPPTPAPSLQATYFDGKSAQAQAVVLHIDQGQLHIRNDTVALSAPVNQVQWPERTRHGKRMAHLPRGGTVQCADGAAWDTWSRSSGLQESKIVALQQSWRWVGASVLALVVVLGGLYQWGLPLLAQGVVALTPHSIDMRLGAASLASIDDALMEPSELPQAQQDSIRAAFAQALGAQPPDTVPLWSLEFRKSKIGPNALALPGGTILMTDDMVTLVDGNTQVLTAVLAHELGHVRHRHGLRMVVQVSALGVMTSLVLGDFSTALAAVPALLGQSYYSREAEREADVNALQVLTAAGIPPRVMATMFEKLEAKRLADAKDKPKDAAEQRAAKAISWLGIAFSSHPADTERMAFFKGVEP